VTVVNTSGHTAISRGLRTEEKSDEFSANASTFTFSTPVTYVNSFLEKSDNVNRIDDYYDSENEFLEDMEE